VCPGFWVHIKREDGYLYAGLYKKGTTIGGLKSWNVVVKDNVKEGEEIPMWQSLCQKV